MISVTVHLGPTLVLLRAELEAARPGLEDEIIRRLTLPNPAWRPGRKGAAPEICLAERVGASDEYLRCPRGALAVVQRVLALYQVPAQLDARAVITRSAGALSLSSVDPGLRDYQREGAQALLAGLQGVLELPTGGGKTRTLSAAMVASGEPGIALVHTEDLADQWQEALTRLTNRAPRRVAGGASDLGPLRAGELAVAMVQTLHAHRSRASALLQSAGAVVFDEVHHAPAETWTELVNACPAKYRWGGTATKGEGAAGELVDLLIGPTLHRVEARTLITRGFLARPLVLPVRTSWQPRPEHYEATVTCAACGEVTTTTYAEVLAGTATCKPRRGRKKCGILLDASRAERGRLIYADAQSEAVGDRAVQDLVISLSELAVDCGRSVLVLAPRCEAVEDIGLRLRERGVPTVAVTGDTPRKLRREGIASVREGSRRVLVATTLADEGLDIPGLDLGINLMSGRAQGRATQRSGRLMRLGGMTPLLIELVHEGDEYAGQWRRRMAAYRREYGRESIAAEVPVSPERARSFIRARSGRAEPVAPTPAARAELRVLAGF